LIEKRKTIKAAEPMPEYFHLLRRETKLSRSVTPVRDGTGSDNVSRSSRCDENIPGYIGSEAVYRNRLNNQDNHTNQTYYKFLPFVKGR
jgi:hypothetical protein